MIVKYIHTIRQNKNDEGVRVVPERVRFLFLLFYDLIYL